MPQTPMILTSIIHYIMIKNLPELPQTNVSLVLTVLLSFWSQESLLACELPLQVLYHACPNIFFKILI